MRHLVNTIAKLALPGALALGVVMTACTANIHDNTADIHDNTVNIDDAKVEVTSSGDLNNVKPNTEVSLNIKTENVILMEPTAQPTSDQASAAGHIQVYLDDYNSTPILITAKATVTVMIAGTVKQGPHKLKCRVHKHDGTATNATYELTFTVTATVTTSGDAG